MKIRIEDHVKLDVSRMAKIALATTERAQLDLYCVAPGQSQKPHVQRFTTSARARGASPSPARTSAWLPARRSSPRPESSTAS